MKAICFILGLFSTEVLWAQLITGDIFKKDSARKEILFSIRNETSQMAGLSKMESTFQSPTKETVLTELCERRGVQLIRYEIDHRQTQRKGSIVVEKDRVLFQFEEKGVKKEVQMESLKDNFVVGPTLVPFVSKSWQALNSGQKVDIRFGVWDRQETVGFTLFKVGQEKEGEQEVVLLKFKPTSFIISALVDPVLFKFSVDGKKLLGMVGRVAPKQKVGKDWKDLDAEVVYTHHN